MMQGKSKSAGEKLEEGSRTFLDYKEELCINERILLQTIAFDFNVIHPYKHVVKMLSYEDLGFDAKETGVAQTAWSAVNDSLVFGSTLCLRYPAVVVAIALIYFAAGRTGFELPSNWYTKYVPSLTRKTIDDICNDMSAHIEYVRPLLPVLQVAEKSRPKDSA
eukprot:Opistho-2@42332